MSRGRDDFTNYPKPLLRSGYGNEYRNDMPFMNNRSMHENSVPLNYPFSLFLLLHSIDMLVLLVIKILIMILVMFRIVISIRCILIKQTYILYISCIED